VGCDSYADTCAPTTSAGALGRRPVLGISGQPDLQQS